MKWFGRLPMARRVAVLAAAPILALGFVGGSYAVNGSLPFSEEPECTPTPSPTDTAAPATTTGEGDLSLSFSHSPGALQPQGSVTWRFAVRNASEETVTLTFPTGQNGDVELTKDGHSAYRWSDGQIFTQATRTVDIPPGDAWSFDLDDEIDLEPGTYQLTATVSSDPAPGPFTDEVQIGTEPSGSPSPTPSPTSDASPSAGPLTTPPPATDEATPTPTPSGGTS